MQPNFDELRSFLNDLKPVEQRRYAKRCKTSIGYLRKAMSAEQELGEALAIRLDRESAGRVDCKKLRPDVDWAYLAEKQGNDGGSERRAAPG